MVYVEVELDKVVEESEVGTDVPRAGLLPLDFGESEVFGGNTCHAVVVAVAAVLVVDDTFAEPCVTVDTPSRTDGEHADNGAEGFEELFVGDVPTSGDTGEYAPLVSGSELRHTVGAHGGVDAILRAEAVVERTCGAGGVSLPGAGTGRGEVSGDGGVGDASVDTGAAQALGGTVRAADLEASEHLERVVLVLEVGHVNEAVACGEGEGLVLVVGGDIDTLVPCGGDELVGVVRVVALCEGVHVNLTGVVELVLVVFLAEELVLEGELGCDGVGGCAVVCEVGDGDGVAVTDHVAQVVGREVGVVGHQSGTGCCGGHDVVFAGVVVLAGGLVVLPAVYAHVRHGLVGVAEEVVVVVLVVLGIDEREVRAELDAVADVVVEGETCGEAVETLLDDGTGLVVVVAADAERCLLTTSGEVDTVVVGLSELCDFVNPVGILVVVGVVCGVVLEVHELHDSRCHVALLGVEVCLLEHHGVSVTVEHLHAFGLPCSAEAV